MAVYIISRDGAGDGSGLIIKSSFNCILLHYNDVTKLARRLCVCAYPMYNVHVRGGGGGCAGNTLGHQAPLCDLTQLI